MQKITRTQAWALGHIFRTACTFLAHYSTGEIDRTFFLNGMAGILQNIDTFIRENGGQATNSGLPNIVTDTSDVTTVDVTNKGDE